MVRVPTKMIIAFVLMIIVTTAVSCYVHNFPWGGMREFLPMKTEVIALGPVHPFVPTWVLYIDESCTLVDELGDPVTNLSVIRGGIVTIWNKSGTIAGVDFGDAYAPPGDVRLKPDWGVWRRVRLEAPEAGCEVRVFCSGQGESSIMTLALPDTVVTPPPEFP